MKKNTFLACAFSALAATSNAQSISLNPIEGIASYRQPSNSTFTPNLKVATSTSKANIIQVSENGGPFKDFGTQPLAANWSITKDAVYSQSIQGGQKRTFLKTKTEPSNTGIWVVRIVRAFDANNVLLNTSTNDSTLFPNILLNNPNAQKIIDKLDLSNYTNFALSNIELETLYVDNEGPLFKNESEYVGSLTVKIYDESNNQNKMVKNGGYIFSKQANANASSYIPMAMGKRYPAENNPTINFDMPKAGFNDAKIKVEGFLGDIDPTKPIESSSIGLMTIIQEEKKNTSMNLANCKYGNNYIDIKKGSYHLRIHFKIVGKNQ